MAREFMCLYHSYLKSIEPLNYAERGRLFTACLEYSMTGEVPELGGNERFLFPMMKEQIDRDNEKYRSRCATQAKNASMRWHAVACDGMPTDAKHAKEKEKEKNKKPTVSKPPLSPLEGAIKEFCDHRKKLRKPMTDHAIDLFRKRLDDLASSDEKKIDLINTAIERGWQTVYLPDKPQKKANNNYAQRPFDESNLDGVLLNLEG